MHIAYSLYKSICYQLLCIINRVFPQQLNTFKLNAVYFEETDSFPEVEQFILEMQTKFNLNLYRFPSRSYHNLKQLIEKHELKAIVMGTRVDDPNGQQLEIFAPSDIDKGFQPFMRVHPILKWRYKQIWEFLRQFKLPYCVLYDQGYTYLGNKENCQKNERLRKPDGGYYPAYTCLDQYEQESRLEQIEEIQLKKKNEL